MGERTGVGLTLEVRIAEKSCDGRRDVADQSPDGGLGEGGPPRTQTADVYDDAWFARRRLGARGSPNTEPRLSRSAVGRDEKNGERTKHKYYKAQDTWLYNFEASQGLLSEYPMHAEPFN